MRLTAVWCLLVIAACSGDQKTSAPPSAPPESAIAPPAIDPPAIAPPAIAPPAIDPPASDAVIERIKRALPRGWSLERTTARLTLRRNEKVWSLRVNRINAPPSTETPEEQLERLKKHGNEIHAELSYRLEPRWTVDMLAEAMRSNETTLTQISRLPKKHDIEKLRSKFANSKGGETYVGKSAEEKNRVTSFRVERSELQTMLRELPVCHTERYSLFLDSVEGLDDAFHLIYPEEASEELVGVQQDMKKLCDGD